MNSMKGMYTPLKDTFTIL